MIVLTCLTSALRTWERTFDLIDLVFPTQKKIPLHDCNSRRDLPEKVSDRASSRRKVWICWILLIIKIYSPNSGTHTKKLLIHLGNKSGHSGNKEYYLVKLRFSGTVVFHYHEFVYSAPSAVRNTITNQKVSNLLLIIKLLGTPPKPTYTYCRELWKP